MTIPRFEDLFGDDRDSLTSDVKRNIIRNTLPGFIEEGYSANKALQAYRDVGLGIRESDFRDIYREVLGIEEGASRIINVPNSRIPSEGIFQPATIPQTGRYRYVAEFSVFNSTTGELEQAHFGFDTNFRGTINDIESAIWNNVAERYPQYEAYLQDVQIVRAYLDESFLEESDF